jgi:hypothetical protein
VSISVYINSNNSAKTVVAGLYSNSNGRPGSLIASGSLASPVAAAWNTVTIGSASVASGDTYWVTVLGTGGTLYFRDRSGGSCDSVNSSQSNLQSLPSSWTSGAQWNTCPASAYVNGYLTTQAPPVGTALPAISGTAQQGQTLTTSNGSWSNSPTSYKYAWQDCNSSGTVCTTISNATSSSYTLEGTDVGAAIRSEVTATNAGGSAAQTSGPTEVVAALPPSPPANSALPTISGTTQQGQALSTSNGTWSNSPSSYTYHWEDCNSSGSSCTTITGATASSYTLASTDVADTIRAIVTATNAGGSTPATSTQTAVVSASGSGGTLPAGVTLQPIDGGPSFYCSHGFTVACNDGWDNTSFFPIGPWWGGYDASVWSDVGWNTAIRYTGSDIGTLSANGVFSIIASNDDTSGGFEDTIEPNTVGILANDEPNCWSSSSCGGNGPITPAIQYTPNSISNGRFFYVNNTWGLLWSVTGPPDGTPGGTDADLFTDPVTTPAGTTRHLDLGSVDEYWFSDASGQYPTTYEGGLQYNIPSGTNGGELTTAQSECGCRYGDMIDNVPGTNIGLDPSGNGANGIFEREIQDPTSSMGNSNSVAAPIPAFVEDGNVGASASGTINPPEMNWAVWSSIVHGARMLIYFDHSFAGNCEGDNNVQDSCYQVPYSGQTISIYAQVKATDALVKQLATDINSPMALGYVTVEGTSGSLNGPSATFSGIETRATYNQSAGHFTIFADTRDAETSNPGTVTFHTADKYTGPVTVVCDTLTGGNGDLNPGTCVNRTVTATNGTFSDTFAKGSTVHIYQVP